MSKHLTRARSSECIFLHPTERRTERNGREEDEDENEDGDFDFQPPTPSEPLPHRGARGGAPTFAACAKRTRKKRVPHFRVVRGLALRRSLHCTHCGGGGGGGPNASTFPFLPPSRDCSDSAGEIETRFAYLPSPRRVIRANQYAISE